MSEHSFDLLNIFEIDEPEGPRHLVCFLEKDTADAQGGIEVRDVVGDFDPKADGEFDPETFRLNPEFIQGLVAYMNAEAIHSPELIEQARSNPGAILYLLDPRNDHPGAEPPIGDLLGGFAIADDGTPVPNSFRYNDQHVMFDPVTGPSGILTDRQFYDWLHPQPRVEIP